MVVVLVVFVAANVDAAVGSLDQSSANENALIRCELCKISALKRSRLDDALLPKLFTLFESAHLEDLFLLVDEDTEAMWLKFLIDVKVLSPE